MGVVSFELIVGTDNEVLAVYQVDWLVIYEHSSADFGALRVKHDAAGLVRSLLQGFPQVFDALSVGLQMNEVENDSKRGGNHLPCGLRGRS